MLWTPGFSFSSYFFIMTVWQLDVYAAAARVVLTGLVSVKFPAAHFFHVPADLFRALQPGPASPGSPGQQF